MSSEEIRSLLVKIAKDDKKAFERFFKMYHSRMIRFALLFVSAYEDAEDVVSEVMIKLLRQRQRLPGMNNFEGYLFLAIKNQSLNFNKKNVSRSTVNVEDIPLDLLTDSYVEPFEKLLSGELRDVITRVVEQLPPKRKQVYLLVKDEGMKIREVSELLEISEKTVKKHLELAMRNLRIEIERHYQDTKSETPIIGIPKRSILAITLLILASNL